MKRMSLMFLLLILSSVFLTLTSPSANAATNIGTPTLSSVDFEINRVDHVVQIQDGGLVIIKDTVNVSLAGENAKAQNFPIGFPFKYASSLAHCFAHNTLDQTEQLRVTLDAGLGKIGFYGIDVTLPANTINEDSYSLTVVFVFSDLIYAETPIQLPNMTLPPEFRDYFWWNATFPLYPSLVQTASICNVKVILPPEIGDVIVESHSNLVDKGLNVSTTLTDSRQALEFSKSYLENFARDSAWLRFYQYLPSEPDVFLVIDANEIKRDVALDEWGRVYISDFYHLTNNGRWNLTSVKLRLPRYAFDVLWMDETGRIHEEPLLEENATATCVNATIAFRTEIKRNEEVKFTVTYTLPWKEYVSQHGWNGFDLALRFFEREHFDWIIRKLSVAITLPEGAMFQPSSLEHLLTGLTEKGIPLKNAEIQGFSATFVFHNVTPLHDLDFDLTYEYLIFWASFHPTLWVGLLVTVLCVLAFLWRAPKPPPVPVIPVSPEALRSFVEAYERKTNAIRELEMLEQHVRKRKIPRRQYKVRKKALEGRLSVLSRDLSDLKEEIRKAGSRYADIMRQIEVAETELEETEAAIRRIELRYRRREISKGTYRNLLEEYNRRKERAETTIEAVLLRLQEEIR